MHKGFLRTAALLGALAVVLGAFGAHGLKKFVGPETVSTFETGVRYQFYHVFALLALAICYEKIPSRFTRLAGTFFIIGVLLFSGSLYVLTLLNATGTVGLSGIGILTPIGGVFLVLGWLMLFVAIQKSSSFKL